MGDFIAMLYLALLVAGALLLLWLKNDPVPEMRTARALPQGHLIDSGDVVLSGGPRYLTKAVPAGARIGPSNSAAVPSNRTRPGLVPVLLEMEDAANRGAARAGRNVWLCPAKAADAPPVQIVSPLCGAPGTACMAVVGVPPARAAEIAAARPKLSTKPCGPTT